LTLRFREYSLWIHLYSAEFPPESNGKCHDALSTLYCHDNFKKPILPKVIKAMSICLIVAFIFYVLRSPAHDLPTA